MSDEPAVKISSKYMSAGIAAIGLIALAAAGLVTITTPGEQECKDKVSDLRVDMATATAEVKYLTEVKDTCKAALESITRGSK